MKKNVRLKIICYVHWEFNEFLDSKRRPKIAYAVRRHEVSAVGEAGIDDGER